MLDVLGAVYDFLTEYIGAENIVRGWQNRSALPADVDYVVLTLINAERTGTNTHKSDPESETETISMLNHYSVQVDFCGDDETEVMQLAAKLVLLARDGLAVDFFNGKGMSCRYADDPRSVPFTNDQNQWTMRYSVTLHLAAWENVELASDYFGSVNVQIENVDVHHRV